MIKIWIHKSLGLAGLMLSGLLPLGPAQAATADLANRPLATTTTGETVRSNLMFVLDDSGSMDFHWMPDNVSTSDACYGSSDTNFIFFNPKTNYSPPLNADGKSMPNASFTAAWFDGYRGNADGVQDLTQNHPNTPVVYGPVKTTFPRETSSYTCARNATACQVPSPNPQVTDSFDGTDTTTTTVTWTRTNSPGNTCRNNVANSCTMTKTTDKVVRAGVGGRFLWAERKPTASLTSCATDDFKIVRAGDGLTAEQQTNYANWFSYYRTRMLAMRTGAGRAFAKIDAKRFRVGFSKISEFANGGADSTGFLNIRDYDHGTQKVDFFTRLYGTEASGYTPLRPALSRAGRYYANRLSGQSDPVQYSCQRHYTILSTDGYWNNGNDPSVSVPRNLAGSAGVGNPDGGPSIPTPMRDAANKGAGVSDTLADVAMYYYVNDLRTPTLGNCTGGSITFSNGTEDNEDDVCSNGAPGDPPEPQRMVTFTLGLGVSGTLAYDKDYLTQPSGDFFALKQGSKIWPDPIANTTTARIDDLWHAAVNGRGVYYSASNAEAMADSLVDALRKIDNKAGSGGAAATSSLTPVTGDDWVFVPLYNTENWDGTIHAFKVRTDTGELINPDTPVWSAAERIKAQASRRILFKNGSSLSDFTYDNLPSSAKGHFEGMCGSTKKLSQCSDLSADALALLTPAALVNYLRGATEHEMNATDPNKRLFRKRSGPLGDIVGGAPVFVGKPPLSYGEGYKDFAATKRQAVLYVAANDGMLHALKVGADAADATAGQELWAYVPTAVMKDMHALADASYASNHRFFVDGAPVVADVQDGSSWRTILVGGLGKGGRAYYALDITNPSEPKTLWEFTDDDLGYTFGNPVVVKNKAGKWVVAFTSGYNNVGLGTGKGYLYVLDAITGQLVDASSKIATSAGDVGTPSNLGRLNAWIDDTSTGVAQRFYAGDMLGNVWRFDYDNNYGVAGKEAVLLAQVGKPITTKPVLSEVVEGSYRYQVVSVATGRYLGFSDLADKSLQSVYTFKDMLTSTSLGLLRSNPGMVKQTLNADRNGLDNPQDVVWSSHTGWYVDLSLTEGERVNVDMEQQLNQLIVASNIPTPTACSPGGTSWLYYLDVGSGKPLLSYAFPTLIAGITTVQTSTGKLVTLVQGVDGKNKPRAGADPTNLPPATQRRTSWRELAN